jgi:hypothetical protein
MKEVMLVVELPALGDVLEVRSPYVCVREANEKNLERSGLVGEKLRGLARTGETAIFVHEDSQSPDTECLVITLIWSSFGSLGRGFSAFHARNDSRDSPRRSIPCLTHKLGVVKRQLDSMLLGDDLPSQARYDPSPKNSFLSGSLPGWAYSGYL